MRLVTLCSAALFGIVVVEVARPPLIALALAASGCALAACRWRLAGLAGLAFSLGALRAWLPPFAGPFASPQGLGSVRGSAQQAIAAWLPEPQASLATGVLLGGTGHLDPAFRVDLQRSGLSHLVAIDGFKEVVVAAAITWLIGRLCGRRAALVATVAAIAAYTVLTGAHPSAVRAGLMLALANTAALGGRLPDSLTSLAFVTLGMALVEPRVLWDVGLQLSLSATLGIVLLWPRLRRTRVFAALPRSVGEPAGLTLAVSLGTLPVTLNTFHVVSLISPLTHVLAVPLLPLVLVTTLMLAACAWCVPLASVCAWLAWLPTTLLMRVVQLGGSLPGAAITVGGVPVAVEVTLALGLLLFGVWHLPELADLRLWCARRLAAIRSAPTTSAARPGSAG